MSSAGRRYGGLLWMHHDSQRVGDGAYIPEEETRLHLRNSKHGNCVGAARRNHGECWMDEGIWKPRM